jgi:non-lysosomal glucosylceramidase
MAEPSPFLYTGAHAREISFPLGGIGAGSIGLSGTGRFIDWEILNGPDKGSTNGLSHFAVRAERDGRMLDARLLHGPYQGSLVGDFTRDTGRTWGSGARRASLVGVPHFADCTFEGRYPLAHLEFRDRRFPGAVAMTAFNPFVPLEDRSSSMPVAMFAFEIANPTDAPVTYSVVGVLGHGVLRDRSRTARDGGLVRIATANADMDDPAYAELVIATDAKDCSAQTHLYRGLWFDALEVYWKDLHRPGRFRPRSYEDDPFGGGMERDSDSSLLAAHVTVQPGETGHARFVIAWYAPNYCKSWVSKPWHFRTTSPAGAVWKNWYATVWPGADAIAAEALDDWDRLAGSTFAFRDAIYSSTLPHAVLDAAAANLSTLRSPTTVRLTDGTFYGWEGLNPHEGSCEGSCTHVWNYAQALPFLFPALERSMREADYRNNMDAAGGMSFRMSLPVGSGLFTERACVDGQFGNVLKTYRDWKLCGDEKWLRGLWPSVRKSVEYAWHKGNPDRWDPERTGVLTGRQHHTLDMELFGPNGWLTGFYVAALTAGAEMAAALGEHDVAEDWRAIALRGRRTLNEDLYNGRWFVQRIDLAERSVLAPYAEAVRSRRLMGGDIYSQYWSDEHQEIRYQLGEGCLIDQLVAGWHARLYGLPNVFDDDKASTALRAILRHNFKQPIGDFFNPCRVYGVYDEAGTVIAAYPDSVRSPAVPVPYAQETFHGMEYAFGAMLMMHGMLREGVRVFRSVRDRYDGAKRNPWNEMECGANYARSLASWSGVLVLSGFRFDARRNHMGFAPMVRAGATFESVWSNGLTWGTVRFNAGEIVLRVLGGETRLCSLGLPVVAGVAMQATINDTELPVRVSTGTLQFNSIAMRAGDLLRIRSDTISISGLPDVSTL